MSADKADANGRGGVPTRPNTNGWAGVPADRKTSLIGLDRSDDQAALVAAVAAGAKYFLSVGTPSRWPRRRWPWAVPGSGDYGFWL
jgi:hypothetical protein